MQSITYGKTDFLSKEDAARELRCSEKTIERMVTSGEMPKPLLIRGMVRWTRPQWDAWIAAGCPEQDDHTERRTAVRSGSQINVTKDGS